MHCFAPPMERRQQCGPRGRCSNAVGNTPDHALPGVFQITVEKFIAGPFHDSIRCRAAPALNLQLSVSIAHGHETGPPKADVDATAVEVQLSTGSVRHKPREDVSRPKKGRTLSREACLCTRTNYAPWHHSRPLPLHKQARRSRTIEASQNEKTSKSHGEHGCSWAFVHGGPFLH